ncbi:type III secretion system invasion protein IagB [Serratia silvae]|uniref:Type III secretion system invasion protein IagB n=1 Tax=Serratia silvae TaxID=2824122 RepID=A0ABT0KA56_9GAMM|nr:type III secretion system invasion protein IagB [Serratia silvae]MCL1028802.1 type III secretion system invasion protein IagB [Serratia silvae]
MNRLPIILMFILPVAKADCWIYAEQKFGIESKLLTAIAQVESGMKQEAKGVNKNGSVDYGLMQINSMHLPRLQRIGISKDLLYKDPCVSVLVGASILSEMMKIYGYSWEAVGAYNAGTGKGRHKLRMKYASKVWRVYNKMEVTKN